MTSDQQRFSEVKNKSEVSSRQEYEEVVLSEVIDPVLGKTPKRKNDEYWGGDIKWASAKDISQNETRKIYDSAEYMTGEGKEASNAKKMPEGTLVVVARGATMGRSAQLGEPMTFNQTCYGLDADNSKLIDDFLYYVWQYRFNQIQSVSHGTVFDTITMDSFKDIEIPLPPLETQKRICNVLTSIDDKIEVNNRIDELLEEMAQAIFKSWFVELDQYDGEVEYDEDFERDIPVSWDKVSLDSIADFLNGKAWQNYSSEDGENDLPVVKIKELRNGITEDSDRVNKSKSPEEYILEDGNIIFSWSASLVLDLWSEGEAFLNQHLFKVTSQDYPRWFCYLWIDHHIRIFRHIADAKKTTMGHIKRSDLNEAKVLIPPKDEVEKMSEEMKPIFEKRVESMIENRRLEELRDALLPKLMSGEVRVNDINLEDLEVSSEV